MNTIGEEYQSADWKKEKHVPVIDCGDRVKEGENLEVTLTVGKEVAHPNTTEHHIRWIQLYFKPEGEKFTYQVGNFEFTAHGESADGANAGPAFSQSSVTTTLNLKKSGTLYATSLCNIHGLWENSKAVTVQ
ncbi:MAG: Neelaredoxin [Nitrospira bacterium SG8_35_1]|nr:MAG: Neelaredoxin [Nitrospira bacterium SG8_35_1]